MEIFLSGLAVICASLGLTMVWAFVCLICLDRRDDIFLFGAGGITGWMVMELFQVFGK